ncbi:hypothetical protein EK904_003362 [Melospiza melodia maxima]|nr:hypothetical protein EK904_003362 [Melospiza melodia maxima]
MDVIPQSQCFQICIPRGILTCQILLASHSQWAAIGAQLQPRVRCLLPRPSLFILKPSSSKLSCSPSGSPRPNLLFTHRYSHL